MFYCCLDQIYHHRCLPRGVVFCLLGSVVPGGGCDWSFSKGNKTAEFVQPGSRLCIGSPERSAKWGPGAPKIPSFSGEKEGTPFLSIKKKKSASFFSPWGLCAAFLFQIFVLINGAGSNREQVSCALDLELTGLFPPGLGFGWGFRLANWGLSPNSLDSPGFRGSLGGGENAKERKEKIAQRR